MANPTTTTLKPFLTRSELAARWSCSISTIKRREGEGELVPTRLGPRTLRYSMAHIEELENQSAIQPRLSGATPETVTAATAGQVSGTSVSGTTTNQTSYAATSTASRKNR